MASSEKLSNPAWRLMERRVARFDMWPDKDSALEMVMAVEAFYGNRHPEHRKAMHRAVPAYWSAKDIAGKLGTTEADIIAILR